MAFLWSLYAVRKHCSRRVRALIQCLDVWQSGHMRRCVVSTSASSCSQRVNTHNQNSTESNEDADASAVAHVDTPLQPGPFTATLMHWKDTLIFLYAGSTRSRLHTDTAGMQNPNNQTIHVADMWRLGNTWEFQWLHSAAPMRNQATSTMIQYASQSHYPGTEPTSPCHILLMLRTTDSATASDHR